MTTGNPILIQPLAPSLVHCPRCSGAIANINQEGMTSIIPGRYVYDDGDSVPDAARSLGAYSCIYMASFGSCPHCQSGYWSLDVYLHTGSGDALIDLLSEDDCPDYRYRHTSAAMTWLINSYATAEGRAYCHSIGPLIAPEDPRSTWPQATRMVVELAPMITSVQAAVARMVFNAGVDAIVYAPHQEVIKTGNDRTTDEPPSPYHAN